MMPGQLFKREFWVDEFAELLKIKNIKNQKRLIDKKKELDKLDMFERNRQLEQCGQKFTLIK